MRRLFLLLLPPLLAACGPDIANRNSTGTEILCFGDSLTAGVGAEPGEDYPSVLARALNRPVINAGVSGNTTADALERLERDVLSRNPKAVVVLLGGNDFLRQKTFEETFGNLDEIVRRIQEKGAMVVLCGVRSGILGNKAKGKYKELAEKRRTALIPDILKGIFGHTSLMKDGIHPNAKGYEIVAERVRKKLEPLL